MKKALIVMTILCLNSQATSANEITCKSKNRTPVSCEKVEGAKRTHLCVKKNVKVKAESVKKYCLKEKLVSKAKKRNSKKVKI